MARDPLPFCSFGVWRLSYRMRKPLLYTGECESHTLRKQAQDVVRDFELFPVELPMRTTQG